VIRTGGLTSLAADVETAVPRRHPPGKCTMCGCDTGPGVWLCGPCAVEDARQLQARADEAWLREYRQSIERARQSIPERFRGLTPSNPRVHALPAGSLAAVQRAVASGDVTITGESGRGKTTAAAAMLWGLFEAGLAAPRSAVGALARGARLIHARDLAKSRAFGDGGRGYGEESAEMLMAHHATVLVLDNVGGEGNQPGRADMIAEVLHDRYQRAARTVVTTTLPLRVAVDRYGPEIGRRLFDTAQVTVVSLDPVRGDAGGGGSTPAPKRGRAVLMGGGGSGGW